MYTRKILASMQDIISVLYPYNLNHIFDNLNDINDSDTDKPDSPLSFNNLIQADSNSSHS